MQNTPQRNVRELNARYNQQHEFSMEQKSKSRRGLIRRLSVLGLFVVIIFISTIFSLHSQEKILNEKLEKKRNFEQEFARLQVEQKDLQIEIENLNNLDYIAEVARKDYYLSKPGEIIFKVTSPSSD